MAQLGNSGRLAGRVGLGPLNGNNGPNNPHNFQTGNVINDVQNWQSQRGDNLATSVYWQYLQKPDVFICPVFAAKVVGSANWETYAMKLSSYCMNGAVCFYPGADGTSGNLYHYQTAKASSIWSPLCIIQWEPSGTSGNDNGYNDGANYPDTSEGVATTLHTKGANVLTVGGSAQMMQFSDFLTEMNNPVKGDCSHGRGLLWWNNKTCDGHSISTE